MDLCEVLCIHVRVVRLCISVKVLTVKVGVSLTHSAVHGIVFLLLDRLAYP